MGKKLFQVFVALMGFLLIVPGFISSVQAEGSAARTITMTGRASVGAVPDRVEINLGVTSKSETARDALTLNNVNMHAVIKTLKAEGVEQKFIQTSNFSINPEYQHFKNGRPPVIKGYTVSNAVRIQVNEIANLGILLDKVVSAGSNRINSIRFYVSREDELKDEARKKAVAVARRKAGLYTDAANIKLGKVLTITESSRRSGNPLRGVRTFRAASNTVPISGGEQQLSVSVTITWEIN